MRFENMQIHRKVKITAHIIQSQGVIMWVLMEENKF